MIYVKGTRQNILFRAFNFILIYKYFICLDILSNPLPYKIIENSCFKFNWNFFLNQLTLNVLLLLRSEYDLLVVIVKLNQN